MLNYSLGVLMIAARTTCTMATSNQNISPNGKKGHNIDELEFDMSLVSPRLLLSLDRDLCVLCLFVGRLPMLNDSRFKRARKI
jgi:hypothetical protein